MKTDGVLFVTLIFLGVLNYGWVIWPNLGTVWAIVNGLVILAIVTIAVVSRMSAQTKRIAASLAIIVLISGEFLISSSYTNWSSLQTQSDYHPNEKSHDSADQKGWNSLFTDPIAFFTLCIAAFTGGLWVATFRLWASTHRLVEGSEDTGRRQLRAYVHLEDILFEPCYADDGGGIRAWRLRPVWKNTGSTPIKHGRTSVSFMYSDNGELPNTDKSCWPDGMAETKSVFIGPHASIPVETEAIQLANFDHSNLKRRYFMWGWITYHDVFATGILENVSDSWRDSQMRKSDFCLEILISGDVRYIQPTHRFRYRFDGNYNGAT